jgi:soluble lytic murein transglycosylase-like protein
LLQYRIWIAAACVGACVWSLPGLGRAADTESPRITVDTPAVAPVLSDADISRYQRIFEVQEDGKWPEADKLIKQLDNKVLMGHVMFQRYMHPTDYRSTYKELSGWLAKYADLPGADRIYRLAMHRKPYDVKAPRKPEPLTAAETQYEVVDDTPKTSKRTHAQRQEARQLMSRVRNYLRRGEPNRAEKRLWATSRTDLLAPDEFDEQSNRIAVTYLNQGNYEKALALASLAAARSRKDVVSADWTAGLAAWQLGDYDMAFQSFSQMADSKADGWLRSAGAYWASRAAVRAGTPQASVPMLEKAVQYPHTFYGLVAAEQLGVTPDLEWDMPVLTDEARRKLMKIPGVERAAALRDVGMTDIADVEMKMAWKRSNRKLDDAFLSLASYLNLPATQVQLSLNGNIPDDFRSDAGSYPVPDWVPEGGFQLDPALVFAFVRQESLFDPQARSWAGARGLMQLMPATASFISGDRSLARRGVAKLFDPQFNMRLGQKYLKHLMETDYIGDNLFLLAAAYNGGPGNLGKWLRASNYGDDWLLFMETIPAQETRLYVERVMTNYWIYRLRLNQATPSLMAVASGEGPRYLAQAYPVTATADDTGQTTQ